MSRKRKSSPTTWRATFVREVGRPSVGAAEVDSVLYFKSKPVLVGQAVKERLEQLPNLEFTFEEAD